MSYRFKVVNEQKVLECENKIIHEGLVQFNKPFLGDKPECFTVLAKDKGDNTIGGAIVYAHPKSVYVDMLWVSENHRGSGIGKSLLAQVEIEARKRNIMQCTLDTYSFQAEKFYLKQGYKKIGIINDYIDGYDRIYLRKIIK